MRNPAKAKYKKRIAYIIYMLATFLTGLAVILYFFNDNIVFYYTPSELHNVRDHSKAIRVGGVVERGSIWRAPQGQEITFTITDFKDTLKIRYQGAIPSLFAEGQGTVALGHLNEHGELIASELLAKHDENYMPKDVAESPELPAKE